MSPSTIGGINKLPESEKRAIYGRYIPKELIQKFDLPDLPNHKELLQFRFAEGSSDVEMRVYHQVGFQDPVLYAHLADTSTDRSTFCFISLTILRHRAST